MATKFYFGQLFIERENLATKCPFPFIFFLIDVLFVLRCNFSSSDWSVIHSEPLSLDVFPFWKVCWNCCEAKYHHFSNQWLSLYCSLYEIKGWEFRYSLCLYCNKWWICVANHWGKMVKSNCEYVRRSLFNFLCPRQVSSWFQYAFVVNSNCHPHLPLSTSTETSNSSPQEENLVYVVSIWLWFLLSFLLVMMCTIMWNISLILIS